ncbi:imidazolonepropionase [Candidatus Uabimicrobium amorphum]|uniref:Imidazolonepropionase n=1 Tax=Uabimicrobium amorphum TaxID=2596890 RepID=A0A5S9IV99_UABAM|nr:imidazolonepropionase [Candidatus Uabimicrobium amorphum]BBM87750.1 imidazolonepropionase [Candidatus Uabimicrobium amorphum]
MVDLLIRNIGQLLSVPLKPKGNEPCDKIGMIKNGALAIKNGKIEWMGADCDVAKNISGSPREIDAKNHVVCPAFIDAHTHISGYPYGRADDFEVRIFGEESYAGIARKGGGIRTTIQCTQQASDAELQRVSGTILDEFMRHGVGTLEAKSGYGLEKEHEMRQIKLINELASSHAMTIIPTYLAHVLHSSISREEYVAQIVKDFIPHFAAHVKCVDVFCDAIAFSVTETQQIITAALDKHKFVSIHADQTSPFAAAEALAPMGVSSLSHLENISDAGIRAMKENDTIAIVFPTCSVHLNAPYSPYEKFVEAGIRVALSTDWNPGSSPCSNILLVGYFAAKYLRMPLHEVLRSITVHPACALHLESHLGSLEVGKEGDFCIFELQDWRDLFTQCGNTPRITLYKKGEVAFCS